MKSNNYTNMILTVIAIFLLLIVGKIYDVPESALADPLRSGQDVFVTNSDDIAISIAMENYRWKDGVPEYLSNPPDLTE